LRQFANESPKFLNHVATHSNFEWATRYLFLESDTYMAAGLAVFEIVKLAVPVVNNYTTKSITLVLQLDKMTTNYGNMLR
jgi:hypothetical protein